MTAARSPFRCRWASRSRTTSTNLVSSLRAQIDVSAGFTPVRVGYFVDHFNNRYVFDKDSYWNNAPLTVDNTAAAIADAVEPRRRRPQRHDDLLRRGARPALRDRDDLE